MCALFVPIILFAQEHKQFEITYQKDTLNGNYPMSQNIRANQYFDSIKVIHDKTMKDQIAYSENMLEVFRPQSPLSNYLTDALFTIGDSISQSINGNNIDFSILNFGGIRTNLPQGNITIGDVYKVLSFDNHIVIASVKGSDVKIMLEKFTPLTCQAYSNVQITYHNNRPFQILVAGKPIDENRIYRFATLDFIIKNHGDHIIDGVQILQCDETTILWRDAFIQYLKEKINIYAKTDKRVIIPPQP